MTSAPEQAIARITGIQAAGKSTVAQMLAGSNVCLAWCTCEATLPGTTQLTREPVGCRMATSAYDRKIVGYACVRSVRVR
jgi:hypothetical protein